MGVDHIERRMAAILVADVVGYSQLMGKDEETTLATLKLYRRIIDGLIAHHQGRVFGSAGDSVLAEFASSVEAVRCATGIQLEIYNRNTALREPNRMRFRIGINLGDVLVDGDNLMGDGVNVAARLETLAPPGGICISEAIHAQVRDRLSLDFLDLGEHKVKNIARPVRAYRVPLRSEEQIRAPFRGLDRFEFDHSDLFFGRSHAIATCIERLERLANSGNAFLLIYGMSGSGKSSLLRAGLMPTITKVDASAGVALWRRCLVRPSEGPDAVQSLAFGLLREEALPEIAAEKAAGEFADLIRASPERALAPIRSALAQAAAAQGLSLSQVRLVVAVDQMEELFTTERDQGTREAIVRILATLASSGLAWVIGTMRADFFHRCSEIAGFSKLKDGLGNYELLPPTGPEIAQIIREPARAAGLRFEEDRDHGRLDDVLQEAAVADPGSLPLLEFVLDALYQAGRSRGLLTFAAYRALGGLEGAIARRADEVIDALPLEIQEALPAVLRALTTVRWGDEAITARPAFLGDVANTAAKSALIDALIGARLLVSDEGAEGQAVIRLAHEALLNRWPLARDIVSTNRKFLETRARLQSDARRWFLDDRNPDLLLPSGVRLAEGEDLLQSRREEAGEQVITYIEASSLAQKVRMEKERDAERARIEVEESARRERLEREAERRTLEAVAATRLARRTRHAAILAILLAVVAGVGAVVGFKGRNEALRSAGQAQEAENKALEARDQALRNQSLSLALLSQQVAMGGDTEAAILLALESLPKQIIAPDRPYLVESEIALYNALLGDHNAQTLHHDAALTDAQFDKAGNRIVTASYDGTAQIWNVSDGSQAMIQRPSRYC
ncbi:MAG: adenylate/guanylate cyclase domain-containing protein [Hyphomicrobiales bacterium]